jgi:uncharacterized membrane protein
MMGDLALPIGVLSVACGVVGGVFFAFSSFVIRALGAVAAPSGIRAMQSINVAAVTPLFMTALFGTGLACLGMAAYAVVVGMAAATLPIVAGATAYILGAIVVTIVCNVPLNNSLAVLDPDAGDAVWIWARYRRQWLAWNHVRALASILAAAWFAYALTLLYSA